MKELNDTIPSWFMSNREVCKILLNIKNIYDGAFFYKKMNGSWSFTIFAKKLHIRCLIGS